MDPPAVRAAVQEMQTATRTEVSFTLDLLKGKKVARGDGRHGTLHGPAKRRANQMLMETVTSTPQKMDATAERGVFVDDF